LVVLSVEDGAHVVVVVGVDVPLIVVEGVLDAGLSVVVGLDVVDMDEVVEGGGEV